jgi:hypothetical protein
MGLETRTRLLAGARLASDRRDIPTCFDQEDRRDFLVIANRNKVEALNTYVVLGMGVTMFYQISRLRTENSSGAGTRVGL